MNTMPTVNSANSLDRILFSYPILKGVISELEPGEFRNLLLSGQRLPMSRDEADKYLIFMECGVCEHSNATRKVFSCVGTFTEPINLDLEKIESYWSQLILASNFECKGLKEEAFVGYCQLCMQADFADMQNSVRVQGFPCMQCPMCKTHCLENFHPPLALPMEKCRCEALLTEEGWRCMGCFVTAFGHLHVRGQNFKSALRYRQTTTTFATQEPTFEYRAEEPSLEETCCMMDCRERVWDDLENPAFVLFCARCSTIYKENDMAIILEACGSASS